MRPPEPGQREHTKWMRACGGGSTCQCSAVTRVWWYSSDSALKSHGGALSMRTWLGLGLGLGLGWGLGLGLVISHSSGLVEFGRILKVAGAAVWWYSWCSGGVPRVVCCAAVGVTAIGALDPCKPHYRCICYGANHLRGLLALHSTYLWRAGWFSVRCRLTQFFFSFLFLF